MSVKQRGADPEPGLLSASHWKCRTGVEAFISSFFSVHTFATVSAVYHGTVKAFDSRNEGFYNGVLFNGSAPLPGF